MNRSKRIKRIFIADDHPIFRSGLREIIAAENDYEVVGEASDGSEAVALIEEKDPDVAVIDINMPGLSGFEVIEEARKRGLKTEFVILSMHDDEKMFAKAMNLDVRGYVIKDSAAVDIINCLQAVCRGQNYTSAAVTTYLIKRASGKEPVAGLESLTPTERRILRKVAENDYGSLGDTSTLADPSLVDRLIEGRQNR